MMFEGLSISSFAYRARDLFDSNSALEDREKRFRKDVAVVKGIDNYLTQNLARKKRSKTLQNLHARIISTLELNRDKHDERSQMVMSSLADACYEYFDDFITEMESSDIPDDEWEMPDNMSANLLVLFGKYAPPSKQASSSSPMKWQAPSTYGLGNSKPIITRPGQPSFKNSQEVLAHKTLGSPRQTTPSPSELYAKQAYQSFAQESRVGRTNGNASLFPALSLHGSSSSASNAVAAPGGGPVHMWGTTGATRSGHDSFSPRSRSPVSPVSPLSPTGRRSYTEPHSPPLFTKPTSPGGTRFGGPTHHGPISAGGNDPHARGPVQPRPPVGPGPGPGTFAEPARGAGAGAIRKLHEVPSGNGSRNRAVPEDAADDDDDDDEDEEEDEDEDIGEDSMPRASMSLNLMKALGMDTSGMEEEAAKSDWKPPERSGLQYSDPLIATKHNARPTVSPNTAHLHNRVRVQVEDDEDDDDEEEEEDDDGGDEPEYGDDFVPSGGMSRELRIALGLEVEEEETVSDWKPPARSGLQYSSPIIPQRAGK